MAAKRKSKAPPPPPPSPPAQSDAFDKDSSSSSSDEDQTVAQFTTVKTIQPTERDRKESESESDSGSESEPNPPTQTLNPPRKPSESEDSSDEEEEEEAEKPQSLANEPESETGKKKLKLSAPEESPSNSKKKAPIQRIWSSDDEMTLLQALSEYRVRHGKLPSQKDYASFLATIRGSINFPVAENQLYNKIRQMRHVYNQKRKKGSDVKFSNPNERAVFDVWKSLFDGSNKKLKNEKTLKQENVSLRGDVTNGAAASSVTASGAVGVRSEVKYAYLTDLIRGEELFPTIEDVAEHIGESRAEDLEAKAKKLKIDSMRLCARKENLKAELLTDLADGMEDD